jgi:hypothetical protein
MAATAARRAELLWTGAPFLALVLLQCVGISHPFLRQHESNGTEFGKHARNHLKFGLGTTRGLMLDVSGPRLDAYPDYRDHYYSNHPPLSALLLAAVFVPFGGSELTIRAVLVVLSVAAFALFRLLALRVLPPPYSRIATAGFALLPMFVYYSIVTVLHVVALLGILAALLSYLRWVEIPSPGRYAAIVGSIFFACYSSWEGYYAAPALVIAHLWSRRPRRAAVLALLGVNVAIFGVYLLHLWAADPSRLAPLRSLLAAGTTRTVLSRLAILPYLVGEAKEFAVMFTLPVLALGGVWIASLVREPRGDADGLILGTLCLGLHEIVFAKLASQHEYYSYFLIIPASLGGAAGLRRLTDWLRARSPAGARAVAALLAVAFLGQSAWILQRRLCREGGYEFYYRLGEAIRSTVAPEEKVFVLTDNIPFYTPYYGDRYSLWYDARNRLLMAENTGPRRTEVREEEILRLLRDNPGRLDWAVTADKATALPAVAWLRNLDDASLDSFGVETRRTPRRELLEQRYGAPRVLGGFLFWKLTP